MDRSDIRHWCWRIARIFIACLLLTTTLGAIDQLLYPLRAELRWLSDAVTRYTQIARNEGPIEYHDDRQRFEANVKAEEQAAEEIKLPEEIIIITAADRSLQASLQVNVEKRSPFYRELLERVAPPKEGKKEDFTLSNIEYLGLIAVNGRTFKMALHELAVDEETGMASFRFVGDQIAIDPMLAGARDQALHVEILFGDKYESGLSKIINIDTTPGITVVPGEVAPVRQSAGQTVFQPVSADQKLAFYMVYPIVSNGDEARPIWGAVQAVNEGFPIVQSLLIGILYSLPFLLFFVLKLNSAEGAPISRSDQFSDVAALLLILYIGLTLLNFTIDLLYFIPEWLDVTGRIHAYYGYPSSGVVFLMIVFPAYIWPNIVKRWDRTAEPSDENSGDIIFSPRRPVRLTLAIISVVMWLASLGLLILNGGIRNVLPYTAQPHFPADYANPEIFVLLASLYSSTLWALYELYGRFVWARAIAVFFLLIFICTIAPVLYSLRLQTYFTIIVAIPFIYACIGLAYRLYRSRSFKEGRRTWPWYFRVWLLPLVIVSLYVMLVTDRENLSISIVSNLAYTVARFGIFALLFILLRALRNHSEVNDSWTLPPEILNIGGVIALGFLFLPSRQWMYVLIVFLTAYFLLNNWAFVAVRSKKLITRIRRSDTVRALIREKVAINECERGIRILKKEMLGKIGKGEITFEDYESKIKALEKTIKEKKESMAKKSVTYNDLMLLGPVDSAWERGKTGALYGFLFSLPWILISIFNMKKTVLPNMNFEILSVFTTTVLSLIQWPLQGFLFGYYYPHLRGGDGMRKGFNFFLLFFIPAFVATVFARETTGAVWTSHLLWSLQLFIQSMLLGLIAGDYQTLRRSGMNWRHLVEVHNLSSLTVWGSSVIVAISAAITTLITSGASSLITTGVKALLPDLIPVTPPK